MSSIFVSHPYARCPESATRRVAEIARALALDGSLPLAPHIYLPQFLDEGTERDLAIWLCLKLVELSDEVRVYGPEISKGMRLEIDHAKRLGIPVVRGDDR